MNLTIPQSYSAVTLGQYLDYAASDDPLDKLMAITGADEETCRSVEAKSVSEIISLFDLVLSKEVKTFEPIIEVEDKKFGLIPNFNRISYGEFEDINAYCNDFKTYSGHILSIIYRPITEKVGDHYLIEAYSPARSEVNREYLLKTVTLDIFDGAMLFFSTISNELAISFLESFPVSQTIRKMTTELKAAI